MLQGMTFDDVDSLQEVLDDILNNIPCDTLENAFRKWLQRVEQVIAAEGEYCE
jgi:hypothetical protein